LTVRDRPVEYPIPAASREMSGAVAQLGARLHGMQEVQGSNPCSSIEREQESFGEAGAFLLRRDLLATDHGEIVEEIVVDNLNVRGGGKEGPHLIGIPVDAVIGLVWNGGPRVKQVEHERLGRE
jgi:hypothetical protein